jgi:pimeloyl-ACP methyl ester carboxylesterase
VKKFTWIILFLFAALAVGCTSSDDDDSNGDGSGGTDGTAATGEAGSGGADGGEAGSGGADGGEAGSGGSGGSGDEVFFDCDPEENNLGLYGINCPVLDPEECDTSRRPIVIVHGGFGTADQFEALALRFASNGYCMHYMVPYDYNTYENSGGIPEESLAALETVIDDILEATGQDQVDLVGHSLGTAVSQTFLTNSADRAAKVAHYANVEGGAADSLPGGVPSISFIGDASHGGEITGGTNVLLTGGVDHVGAAVHPRTSEEMFKFFNDGEEPQTLEILPGSKILVSGKLVQFDTAQTAHTQEGEVGTIDIFEVDRDTGERVNEEPDESFEAREDGTWGPFEAKPDTYYEFQMTSNMRTDVCHYYREPFIRSDAFVYLKIADIITDNIEFTDDYTMIITVRNKALWRGEDVLTVEGTEVSDNPACEPDKNNIGYFIYDDLQDGESVMDQSISSYDSLPFVNGIDYYISPEPHRTIEVKLVDRDSGVEHLVNVPSLKCLSEGVVVVQVNDFD